MQGETLASKQLTPNILARQLVRTKRAELDSRRQGERERARSVKLLPRLTKSKAERLDPRRVIPKVESEEPKRVNARMLRHEPRVT